MVYIAFNVFCYYLYKDSLVSICNCYKIILYMDFFHHFCCYNFVYDVFFKYMIQNKLVYINNYLFMLFLPALYGGIYHPTSQAVLNLHKLHYSHFMVILLLINCGLAEGPGNIETRLPPPPICLSVTFRFCTF